MFRNGPWSAEATLPGRLDRDEFKAMDFSPCETVITFASAVRLPKKWEWFAFDIDLKKLQFRLEVIKTNRIRIAASGQHNKLPWWEAILVNGTRNAFYQYTPKPKPDPNKINALSYLLRRSFYKTIELSAPTPDDCKR